MSTTKLDHITYQVPFDALRREEIADFFVTTLIMEEVDPDGAIEKDWNVRWFEDADGFTVHLVEAENNRVEPQQVDLALGHFCAVIPREFYQNAVDSKYCERNSGSGRAWLKGPAGIRVEIRPKALTMNIPPEGRELEIEKSTLPPALDPPSEDRVRAVLLEAHEIYVRRNQQHKDSWRREGLRGCLFNLRRKAERAWDYLFNADFDFTPSADYDEDDLLDVINYAALSIISKREGNRDGIGGWWS